jgi:putative restriction endonuclease
MSEYEALKNYLESLPSYQNEAAFSFEELERLLGRELPPSARKHRPWWENEYSSESHSHAQAWIQAGWKVDKVDMDAGWVRFVRAGRRKWLQRSLSRMGGR